MVENINKQHVLSFSFLKKPSLKKEKKIINISYLIMVLIKIRLLTLMKLDVLGVDFSGRQVRGPIRTIATVASLMYSSRIFWRTVAVFRLVSSMFPVSTDRSTMRLPIRRTNSSLYSMSCS